jgi:cell division protease FtsH
MSERIGLVQLAPRENPYLGGSGGYTGEKPFSDPTGEAIDAEVQKIIGGSHEQAKRLLSAHRKQLDALAEALVERETLNEQEILEITGLPPAPPLETQMLPVHGVNGGNANASHDAPSR